MAVPKLSVVLPTYKEAPNLRELIPHIERAFASVPFELIVVDDNSQDGTRELLERLQEQYHNVVLVERPRPTGIGSAVRDGYNRARGEYILSSDADQSFAVADMVRLYEKIQEGYDLVLGCRHGAGGGYERRTLAVKAKYLFSRGGNFVVRAVSGLGVRDVSANFRIIRRDAWEKIHTRENTNSLLFEMVAKSVHAGFRVTEIPITFSERKFGESKLNMWKEAPKFLVKFVKYRWLDR